MAFVDENGKYKDHLTLKYFAIPNADQHVDQLIKTHYKDDEIALNVFLLMIEFYKRLLTRFFCG